MILRCGLAIVLPSHQIQSQLNKMQHCGENEKEMQQMCECMSQWGGGVATNVDSVLWLIDTNSVDAHRSREHNVIHVVPTKVE